MGMYEDQMGVWLDPFPFYILIYIYISAQPPFPPSNSAVEQRERGAHKAETNERLNHTISLTNLSYDTENLLPKSPRRPLVSRLI